MNRLMMLAILKICGEAVLITTLAGIVVGGFGYMNQWETSLAYSNAFFIAGVLVIVAGAWSRQGAGQEWETFQRISAESFRNMSSGERAKYVIDISSSLRFVILGILSGALLILISVLVAKLF